MGSTGPLRDTGDKVLKRLLKVMYAATAGLEQATIVWETMKQAEQQPAQAPARQRQIGFCSNKAEGLEKSSPSTLDPKRSVPTL